MKAIHNDVPIRIEGAESLPAHDPRRTLTTKVRNLELTPVQRQVLISLRDNIPGFSLKNMPADLAQAILDTEAKTMKEFFDSWAKSIRHNAKEDQKAAKRYQDLKWYDDIRSQRKLT